MHGAAREDGDAARRQTDAQPRRGTAARRGAARRGAGKAQLGRAHARARGAGGRPREASARDVGGGRRRHDGGGGGRPNHRGAAARGGLRAGGQGGGGRGAGAGGGGGGAPAERRVRERRAEIGARLLEVVDLLALLEAALQKVQRRAKGLANAVEGKIHVDAARKNARARARAKRARPADTESNAESDADREIFLAGCDSGIRLVKAELEKVLKMPVASADEMQAAKEHAETTRIEAEKSCVSYDERIARCKARIEAELQRKAAELDKRMEDQQAVVDQAATDAKRSRKRNKVKIKTEEGAAEEPPDDDDLLAPRGATKGLQLAHNLAELVNARRLVRTLSEVPGSAKRSEEEGLLPLLPGKAGTSEDSASDEGSASRALLPTLSATFQIDKVISRKGLDVSASPWTQNIQNMPPPPCWIPPEMAAIEVSLASARQHFQSTLDARLVPMAGEIQVELLTSNQVIKVLGTVPSSMRETCTAFLEASGLRTL